MSLSGDPPPVIIVPPTVLSKHVCSICDNSYNSVAELCMHVNTHTLDQKRGIAEQESVICILCNAGLKNKQDLRNHNYTYHKRPYTCHICRQEVDSSSELRIHVGIHKGMRYSCNECGETFARPSGLLKHRKKRHDYVPRTKKRRFK